MSDLDVFRTRLGTLMTRVRKELEDRDGALSGGFRLKGLSEEEAHRIRGFVGKEPGPHPDRVWIDLAHLDETVRHGYGVGLEELFEALGNPLRFRSTIKREEEELRARILAPALASPLYEAAWFRSWLEHRDTRAAVTRRVNSGKDTDTFGQAVRVLETVDAHACAPETPGAGAFPLLLQNLAVDATGDTKALNNERSLTTLVLSALAARSGTTRPADRDAEERRAFWEANDVVQDDLASRVLALNLPARGPVLGSWLTEAAEHGIPFQITLHQLVRFPPVPTARVIHVCENPAVLRLAAEELGMRARPMLCTEGWPSAAFHRLAAAAVSAGARLRYHGDFDWSGVAMAQRVAERYGADLWRMSAADYLDHVPARPHPLEGREQPTPWDPGLAEAMRERGAAVFEESVASALVEDLAER
ncbi:TIGR02679 family protein [Nocardiopsis terrae]